MTQRLAEADLEPTFGTLNQRRADALSVVTDPFFTENCERLAAFAHSIAFPRSTRYPSTPRPVAW